MTDAMITKSTPSVARSEKAGRLYRMLWRWHFYAGLFCIPFIIVLAITGTTYLFKPQIEAAFDRPYTNLTLSGPASPPSLQVQAALKAVEGSSLKSYQLPQMPNDAVQITIAKGGVDTLVYVQPASLEILKVLPKEDRLMAIIRIIHGELLLGDVGTVIVELAASWAIVMVVSGLYLWWPRNAVGLAGVLWPRLRSGKRIFWRDIHAVTGMWVSFFALFLLLSGLPWTNVWGDGFKMVRKATGTQAVQQDWNSGRSAQAKSGTKAANHGDLHAPYYIANIDDIAANVRAQRLMSPVQISPPSAKNPNWIGQSQADDRISRVKIDYSASDGRQLHREDFGDRHVIDQVVGIGIAAHEGQLFGPLNQALGVLTALGLITLSVSAFVMWRRRAPEGGIGAPPPIPDAKIGMGLGILIFGFALFLPVLGISLIIIALFERLILMRIPAARNWLGLASISPQKVRI